MKQDQILKAIKKLETSHLSERVMLSQCRKLILNINNIDLDENIKNDYIKKIVNIMEKRVKTSSKLFRKTRKEQQRNRQEKIIRHHLSIFDQLVGNQEEINAKYKEVCQIIKSARKVSRSSRKEFLDTAKQIRDARRYDLKFADIERKQKVNFNFKSLKKAAFIVAGGLAISTLGSCNTQKQEQPSPTKIISSIADDIRILDIQIEDKKVDNNFKVNDAQTYIEQEKLIIEKLLAMGIKIDNSNVREWSKTLTNTINVYALKDVEPEFLAQLYQSSSITASDVFSNYVNYRTTLVGNTKYSFSTDLSTVMNWDLIVTNKNDSQALNKFSEYNAKINDCIVNRDTAELSKVIEEYRAFYFNFFTKADGIDYGWATYDTATLMIIKAKSVLGSYGTEYTKYALALLTHEEELTLTEYNEQTLNGECSEVSGPNALSLRKNNGIVLANVINDKIDLVHNSLDGISLDNNSLTYETIAAEIEAWFIKENIASKYKAINEDVILSYTAKGSNRYSGNNSLSNINVNDTNFSSVPENKVTDKKDLSDFKPIPASQVPADIKKQIDDELSERNGFVTNGGKTGATGKDADKVAADWATVAGQASYWGNIDWNSPGTSLSDHLSKKDYDPALWDEMVALYDQTKKDAQARKAEAERENEREEGYFKDVPDRESDKVTDSGTVGGGDSMIPPKEPEIDYPAPIPPETSGSDSNDNTNIGDKEEEKIEEGTLPGSGDGASSSNPPENTNNEFDGWTDVTNESSNTTESSDNSNSSENREQEVVEEGVMSTSYENDSNTVDTKEETSVETYSTTEEIALYQALKDMVLAYQSQQIESGSQQIESGSQKVLA